MSEIFSKVISNNLPALQGLLEEIAVWLEERNLPSHGVQLCLEEIITNTIKYGFANQLEHFIEMRLEIAASSLRLIIVDDGREFNPLQQAEADTSKPIEEREIGGLGIHLVRKLTTAMNYQRVNGRNILELSFAVPQT